MAGWVLEWKKHMKKDQIALAGLAKVAAGDLAGGSRLDEALGAADRLVGEMEEELGKARAVKLALDLERAFKERPGVAAIMPWSRYREFGVAVVERLPDGNLREIDEHDRRLDPRAVAFYADPKNWQPEHEGDEPDYDWEDYEPGAFHKAFDEFMHHPRGIKAPWDVAEDEFIYRGDALAIADALGMDWMRSWIEGAVLEDETMQAPGRGLGARM